MEEFTGLSLMTMKVFEVDLSNFFVAKVMKQKFLI